MYKSIDVFLTEGCGLARALPCVERITGQPLTMTVDDYGDRRYQALSDQYRIVAYEGHTLEDDLGIEFSRFPIVIGFEPLRGSDSASRHDLCRSMALQVASAVSNESDCECIVVEAVQRLVGHFLRGEPIQVGD